MAQTQLAVLSSIRFMGTFLSAMLAYLSAFFISRHRLALEAIALRQQLAVYKRKQPRPKLRPSDRLFWVVLRRVSKNWSEALVLVKPDTVVSCIGPGTACSGNGAPARIEREDRRWHRKSET